MSEGLTIFFGVGNIAEKTLRKTNIVPDFFVDNNPSRWDTKWLNFNIYNPESLKAQNISQIIICTTSYSDVFSQLETMGLSDISKVSPVLSSIVAANQIDSIQFDVLLASGLPSHTDDLKGGGVFRVTGNFSDYSIKKIYSGNCHGLSIYRPGHFAVTDSQNKILIIDPEGNISKVINTEPGLGLHGIVCVDEGFWCACSNDDSACLIDLNGTVLKRLRVSDLISTIGTPQHHVNDISVYDGKLFLSMFSASGSWMDSFLDGAVFKFDLAADYKNPVLTELKMPHSIYVDSNGYVVCDSFNGQVLSNNRQPVFQSNGFVRGFCQANDYIIVCESKNRNFANVVGGPMNACLDSRINFVDRKSKAYRSIQLPMYITEIHSIVMV